MFEEKQISCIECENTPTKYSDKITYIGARTLFDPNFIPSVIIPQKKTTLRLKGSILDAIEDNYATNVNLYGLKGTGKNLLVNQFFDECTNMNNDNNTDSPQFFLLKINCENKEIDQVFFSILSQLGKKLDYQFKIEEIIQSSPGKLWNVIKILINKISVPILLYMQQIEHLPSGIISKFYAFAKSTKNLQIITSINTGFQRYSFKHYEGLQHRIQMDTFNISELRKITQDRSMMAFQQMVEPEAIDLVVDYIADFDLQVPGSCINYLKEIHPFMHGQQNITPNDLRGISQYYFDSFHLDSISLADYIVDTGIEERLFLEYIINYFQKENNFYIPFTEIKKAYQMTSEELGFKPENQEFYKYLNSITNIQILRPSFSRKIQSIEKIKGIYPVAHYLSVPLEELNDILSFSFGILD